MPSEGSLTYLGTISTPYPAYGIEVIGGVVYAAMGEYGVASYDGSSWTGPVATKGFAHKIRWTMDNQGTNILAIADAQAGLTEMDLNLSVIKTQKTLYYAYDIVTSEMFGNNYLLGVDLSAGLHIYNLDYNYSEYQLQPGEPIIYVKPMQVYNPISQYNDNFIFMLDSTGKIHIYHYAT